MSKLEKIASKIKTKEKIPFDNKKWDAGELIVFLAKEVRRLRKNQCKPSFLCYGKCDLAMEDFYLKHQERIRTMTLEDEAIESARGIIEEMYGEF